MPACQEVPERNTKGKQHHILIHYGTAQKPYMAIPKKEQKKKSQE